MSSLRQNRLLVEGSALPSGAAATTGGTRRAAFRRSAGSDGPQRPRSSAVPRQGETQQAATAPTTGEGATLAPAAAARPARSRITGTRAGSAAAVLATGVKAVQVAQAASATVAAGRAAATSRAGSARKATVKAAGVARSVAARGAVLATARAAAAKAVPAKATAPKATAPKAAAPKAVPAKASASKAAAPKAAASAPAVPDAAPAQGAAVPAAPTGITVDAATVPAASSPAAPEAAPGTRTTTEGTPTEGTASTAVPAPRPAPARGGRHAAPARARRTSRSATPTLIPAVDLRELVRGPAPQDLVVVKAPPEAPAAPETAAVVEAAPARDVADGEPARRRRTAPGRRLPGLYLAAALVGALGVSVVSPGEPADAGTRTVSQSVSVAEQLGIQAQPAETVVAEDTLRLEELAASRMERDAEQLAAAAVQAEADRVAAAAAEAAAAEAARPKAVLPVAGARLTSTFGLRWGTLHAGIDLAAPMHTPEYAAADGIVLEAGPASGFGLAVYVQHDNGDVTVYGHMDKILVQPGQVVRAGDTIALLGNRGQSTGPHLHFEVHVGGIDGERIDPLPWLRDRGIDI